MSKMIRFGDSWVRIQHIESVTLTGEKVGIGLVSGEGFSLDFNANWSKAREYAESLVKTIEGANE